MTFPGFPCNDFDFHFAEAGSALAGLIVRDKNGIPIPGVLPSAEVLLTAGAGWTINVAPFVASRTVDRAVLLGGTAEQLALDVAPAPAANARLDVFYTRPAEVGAGDPVEAARVVTGVPGAVPVKPSIPAGAIEIGTFRSQAGQSSAAAGTLTNTFPFTTTAGGLFFARTKAALDGMNLIDGSRGYVLADKRTYVRQGGAWSDPAGKVLWSGTPVYMQAGQTLALSEPVAAQPNGIILVWEEYTANQPVEASFGYTHIHKSQAGRPGGVAIPLTHFDGTMIRKYVYVDAAAIRGHANNAAAPANKLVIARVLSY